MLSDKLLICSVLLLLVTHLIVISALPVTEESTDYDDDYYGDFTGNTTVTRDSSPDILRVGAGLFRGFLGILGAKINFIRSLLSNKELHQHIGNTLETGVNIARGVIAAKTGVLKVAADVGPDVVQGTRSASRLLGSVVRAANTTAPLISDGIQEFTDQIPLITGFAEAYAVTNAEAAQKVVGKFVGSFQCDQQCGQIEDQDLLDECQKQFCEEEEEYNYEDYYNDVL